MKRFLICLLALMLLLPAAQAQRMSDLIAASPLAASAPAQEVYASWQGETLTLMVERAISDHNALAISWQVTPGTQETCYFALEKVYVNGLQVPLTRHINGGANWLSAQTCAGLFDMSQVPKASSYTVAMSFLSLKPTGPVAYLETPDDHTDYLAYQQQIIDWNNQGHVVSTPEGRIQLSQDSYDPDMDYVYQIMAADKVTPWENPAVTFTLTPTLESTGLSLNADFENYGVAAQVAYSPLSMSVTLTQTLSNTLTPEEAQALVRRYAVLDGSGHKDWYTGGAQEMGELTRLPDGSYQSVMTWSTQSLLRLPGALSLTPYTYDAYMSPVYEKAQSLTAPLK